jgi:hypothetical protein
MTGIVDGYATDSTFADHSVMLSSSPSTDAADFGASPSPASSLDGSYFPKHLDFNNQTELEFAPEMFPSSSSDLSIIDLLPSYAAPTSETQSRSLATDLTSLTSPVQESITVRGRGPGRPRGSRTKPRDDRKFLTRVHNESASRSRAKFTASLDKLWNQIPAQERKKKLQELNSSRPLSKAEKVEMALEYVRRLQAKMTE